VYAATSANRSFTLLHVGNQNLLIRAGSVAHRVGGLQRRRSSDGVRESWQIPLWPFQLARFFGTSAQAENVHQAESDLIQPPVRML